MLTYFGRLYAMDEARLAARVETPIEQLEMGAFASRPCGTLSSGQQQRANIARDDRKYQRGVRGLTEVA